MEKGSTSIMAIIADWAFLNDLDKCELKAFVTVAIWTERMVI